MSFQYMLDSRTKLNRKLVSKCDSENWPKLFRHFKSFNIGIRTSANHVRHVKIARKRWPSRSHERWGITLWYTSWMPVLEQDMTMYEIMFENETSVNPAQCSSYKRHTPPHPSFLLLDSKLRFNTLLKMPCRCVTCSEQFLLQVALLCSSRCAMLPYLKCCQD